MDARTTVRLTEMQEELLDIADQLAGLGQPITYARLAAESGRTRETVKTHYFTLRSRGCWPWPITPAPRQPARRREMVETPFVPAEDPGYVSPEELRAQVEALTDLHRRAMIDGRHERDDTPAGIAPDSGRGVQADSSAALACRKLLAEWRRIRKGVPTHRPEGLSYSRPYERRRYRAVDAVGKAMGA